jgi:long-chain acyl-CoA synthetase
MRQMLIADGLRHWAFRQPGKVAVRAGSRELTYGELHERIGRVLGGAAALGLEPGDRVALFAPNCVEYFELYLGLPSAGVIVSAVTPAATAADLAVICEDSGARVLFVHASLEETARMAELDVERTIVIGGDYDAWLAESPVARPELPDAQTEICWLQYTSGTTGKPKGVMVSHHGKVVHYLANGIEYRFSETDRHLAVGSLAHGVTSGKAINHLYVGATVTLTGIFHPERIVRTVETQQITTMMMVPSHLKAILELGPETLGRYDTSSLRTIVVGGAPCAQATKELAIERFGEGVLIEDYGSTELGLISMLFPHDHLTRRQSVGQPAFGVEVKLLDEDGNAVPTGEIGEMYVRSPSMFLGYWQRPEETDAAMRDGFYKTGDVARLDEDGYIYLLDRLNDKIISGGFNVYAREIEEALARHPAVAEVVAFGVPDEQLGEAVRAAVVLSAGTELAPSELEAHCAQELTAYKRPRWIDVMDSLPKNSTGKIQRRALRDPYWVGQDRRIS